MEYKPQSGVSRTPSCITSVICSKLGVGTGIRSHRRAEMYKAAGWIGKTGFEQEPDFTANGSDPTVRYGLLWSLALVLATLRQCLGARWPLHHHTMRRGESYIVKCEYESRKVYRKTFLDHHIFTHPTHFKLA